jgi:hypothetical protein
MTAQGLGNVADDVLVAIFPQVNAKIDQRANEVKAAAIAEIDKKGDEASKRALIGGFVAGLVGVAVGYAIGKALR